jgi:hypothetical protein
MTDITPEAPAAPPLPPAAPPLPPAPPAAAADAAPGSAPEAAPYAGPDPAPDAVSVEPPDGAAPRPPRRKLRAALRWTSAVVVFAAFCGAATYAVTQPERTKIPGLKTPGDGRWTFPPAALPKLPAGKPRPMAHADAGGHHYVDVRSLLVPAPLTATADPAVPGRTGWLSSASFLKLYDLPDAYTATDQADLLRQDGLRHIAARAWNTPDGTRTEICELQFLSSGYAGLYSGNLEAQRLRSAPDSVPDETVQSKAIPSALAVHAFAETRPVGAMATRYAYVYAGDTVTLVLQTHKVAVPEVPFRQTVRLQAQLLG